MLRRILFSACFCLFLGTVVKADPVPITGTLFAQTGGSAVHVFNIAGPNFHASGGVSFAPVPTTILCSPCEDGTTRILVTLRTAGPDHASGVLNGIPYPDGGIGFSSLGTAVFTLQTGVLGNIEITAPIIDFSGIVRFLSQVPGGHEPIGIDFFGQGQAMATFLVLDHPAGIIYDIRTVTFTFIEPVAVAEPATLLLIAMGISGLFVRIKLIGRH
jgi:hypothetical protein